jgi:two-component system, OmpR family, alkaline phosphatase synthesis response regulator PhoP
MQKVLIVEDEKHLAEGLKFNLEAEGFQAEICGNGEQAVGLLTDGKERFLAVILDVMLPGRDGFSVAREVRAAGQFVPILILTARNRPEDVLKGFESGADDFLAKPFQLSILIARLRSLIRRLEWSTLAQAGQKADQEESILSLGGRTIDFQKLEIISDGNSHRLTLMEVELLRYLVKNQGVAITRKEILKNVWGLSEETDTRAIDNFIARLRKYIEDEPSSPRHLLTVRGVGYRLVL